MDGGRASGGVTVDRWRGLLEASTVALDLPRRDGGGTGFVVGPGTVVTCAHVVAGAETVRGRIVSTGDEFDLTVSDEDRYRAANGLDIAFLRCDDEALSTPGVLTSPHTTLGDRMWVFGHPRGDYRAGQWAALEYQGDSRLAFDDPMPMPRGYGTPVGEGFSGSPVVNQRTGAVCGMLARSSTTGSAHMVPLSEILTRHAVPPLSVAWLNALTDEQLHSGRFRHPGPLLREYLAAARDGADEHPYAALLTDTGDIPLSTVYVEQETARAEEEGGARGRPRSRAARPAPESVLDDHRHVLFTGGAGAGKSSLLRRLTFTAASAWRADPARAPRYVPVRVTAGQLLGLPFPEAIAAAVGRDLPGLRRSMPPEAFRTAPLHGVDWLVCLDGLDEVLDPEERRRVIRLIQQWVQEPYLRFAVASRSLLTAEMERLHALERYSLLEFGDLEVVGVARAWFEALKVPDAERRASELAAGLRRGRLSEVARIPLYLTMICVVAALHDLPRNPAELYARFIGVLRERGARRLRHSDTAGHSITPALLERVHDVLRPVAELRQNGDVRPLLDQVLELLAGELQEAPPAEDVVVRALTFTGLVARRGGELGFVHHTLQEYLAAHAVAARRDPADPEALRTVREAIAAERPNLVLFMAAHWHEQGLPLDEFLTTAVDGGGWRELLLCATILSDELVSDEELTARFTRAVLKLSGYDVRMGDLTVDAVLDRLYAVLGPEPLAEIVGDPTVPHQPRLEALRHLVRRGDHRGGELAASLADEDDYPVELRVRAAVLLADAGSHTEACRLLTMLAREPAHTPHSRRGAGVELAALDESAGTAVLCAILTDSECPELDFEYWLRVRPTTSAAHRAAFADALGANPVLARAHPATARYLVGWVQEDARILREVSEDPLVPLHIRRGALYGLPDDADSRAAEEALAADILGDPDASDDAVDSAVDLCSDVRLLEGAARDERRSVHIRATATERLLSLGESALAQDCADRLPRDPADSWATSRTADVLRDSGDLAGSRRLLLSVFTDSGNPTDDRLRCVSPLIALGASEAVRSELVRIQDDTGIGAHDRFSAIEELGDVDGAAMAAALPAFAADGSLPGDIRRQAARLLLNTGQRDAASALLRRIARDPSAGTESRIRALMDLAEVDVRATSETLHRLLDEPGVKEQELWRLLDLADALTPDAPLRNRPDALVEGDSLSPEAFLDLESEHFTERTATAAAVRRTLLRLVDDPALTPESRALAITRCLGLVPYPRWRTLMAQAGQDPLHSLSLHVSLGGRSYRGIYPEVWEQLSFSREFEYAPTFAGNLAGLDPHQAAGRWSELVAERDPEAVTRLRAMIDLMHDPADYDPLHALLVTWAADPDAPLADRIAAAATGKGHEPKHWHALARDPATPPPLRIEICSHLPRSGRYNALLPARVLANDEGCPVEVRAKAAVLLAEAVGDEGRRILHGLSGPRTAEPLAHLAAAAAWEKLNIGGEAVTAYRRVLDSAHADARHRVTAAVRLAPWRTARDAALRTLTGVLGASREPVSVRIEAAVALMALRATAEAQLGLLRLAREAGPSDAERARARDLLSSDLRDLIPD